MRLDIPEFRTSFWKRRVYKKGVKREGRDWTTYGYASIAPIKVAPSIMFALAIVTDSWRKVHCRSQSKSLFKVYQMWNSVVRVRSRPCLSTGRFPSGSYMSACGADRLTPPRPNLRKSPASWFTPSREGETTRPVAIVEVQLRTNKVIKFTD